MRFFTSLPFFIGSTILFLLIALGAVIYVWNLIQDQNVDNGSKENNKTPSVVESVGENEEIKVSSSSPSSLDVTKEEVATDERNEENSAPVFTEAQAEQAAELGVDVSQIEISEEMVACATEAVGLERIEEFKNGDSPTFFESLTLLGCLNDN